MNKFSLLPEENKPAGPSLAVLRCGVATAAMSLAALAVTAPAFAQEATATQGQSGLEEVVVTAQRREESAQKAAIAIDVATAEELVRAGALTATGLNAVAPALQIARGGGPTTSFFVRGVGNFSNNAYSDPAIAFSLDGVFLGRPTATTTTFFDLSRIEVLKGPQGTLYGRNATGGAINVITEAPKLDQTSGYVAGSYGNYNAYDVEAALNLPLGSNTALRVSGKLAKQDGYNKDGSADESGEAIRMQLLSEPADWLRVRLIGDYAHNGGQGPGASYTGVMQFAPGAPASATAPANYVFAPAPSTLDPREGLLTPAARAYQSTFVVGGSFINPGPLSRPFQDDKNWGLSAEIKADLGDVDLTILPAYRQSDLDFNFNGPGFQSGRVIEKDKQTSVEARLTGSVGQVDWLLGGFHFNEDIDGQASYNQWLVQAIQNFKTGTKSSALFGRLTFNATENLRLVGALRYTDDKKYMNGRADNLIVICTNAPPPFGGGCFGGPSMVSGNTLAEVAARTPAPLLPFGFPAGPGPANGRPFGASGNLMFYTVSPVNRTDGTNRLTYRVATEYDVSPASLLYVSYETGYRSGGFNLAVGRESFNPEYITAITLGSKNRFFDNRLQLNLEAYRWRYRDQQISHFGFDSTGGNAFFTENVGRSSIQGVDVDLEWMATETTKVSGSVQYLDSKLNNFVYTTPRTATSLPPVVGCPYANATESDGAGGTRNVYAVNCSGRAGVNSPKMSINAGIEQVVTVGQFDLAFNGAARYRSSRVVGFDYLPQQNSGDDLIFDASVTLKPTEGNWSVNAFVLNLSNETVPQLTQYSSSVGSAVTTVYNPPRTYGLRARVNF